jgi:hypothetical protein
MIFQRNGSQTQKDWINNSDDCLAKYFVEDLKSDLFFINELATNKLLIKRQSNEYHKIRQEVNDKNLTTKYFLVEFLGFSHMINPYQGAIFTKSYNYATLRDYCMKKNNLVNECFIRNRIGICISMNVDDRSMIVNLVNIANQISQGISLVFSGFTPALFYVWLCLSYPLKLSFKAKRN